MHTRVRHLRPKRSQGFPTCEDPMHTLRRKAGDDVQANEGWDSDLLIAVAPYIKGAGGRGYAASVQFSSR